MPWLEGDCWGRHGHYQHLSKRGRDGGEREGGGEREREREREEWITGVCVCVILYLKVSWVSFLLAEGIHCLYVQETQTNI